MVERARAAGRESALSWCAVAALCALAAGLAARDLGVPGLYYDEVIQAEPAVRYLSASSRPLEVPGMRETWLFGGWFPVMTQPYMGALKSQLLIPTFAAFGASPASLRAATLCWGLLGLLLAVLWVREVLGPRVALATGALLAVDPSLLFVSRHDWGSFALSFLCRASGLLLATRGWRRRSAGQLLAGGACLGLGVYNKIDFAASLAAMALALALAAPGVASAALRARRGAAAALLAGIALGAAPLLAARRAVLSATTAVLGGDVGWSEKLRAIAATLDGSYFERLILAGGSFEEMFSFEPSARGPLGLAALLAAVWLALRLRAGPSSDADRARAFALLAGLLSALAVLATPRAARVHHALAVYPFPHLLVAIAATDLWRRGAVARSGLGWQRVAALAGLLAVLAGSAWAAERTASTLRETGGKGRWSDALGAFARELEAAPGAVALALDWGFAGPMRFAARDLAVREPFWRLWRPRGGRVDWRHDGTPAHVYLLQPERLAVFGFGAELLEAVRRLPPGSATVRRHLDRQGDLAFLSVRFARPHRLAYREGFEVRLR